VGEPRDHRRVQDADDIPGLHPPLDFQRHRLPAELIADRQPFEPPSVFGLIHHEVVAPHVVHALRAQSLGAVLALPEPRPLALAPGHAQPLLPPQPLHSLGVDLHPGPPQQRRRHPVAGSRVGRRDAPQLRS